MKQIKKYIIISICIISILIIAIIISKILGEFLNKSSSEKVYNDIEKTQEMDSSVVKDISEYATIERIVNTYNSAINQLDANLDAMMVKQQDNEQREKIKSQYHETGKKTLENILVGKYISKNNWEKELLIYSNNKFYIEEMKKANVNNVNVYIISIDYGEENNTKIIVFNDIYNNTFSVLPSEYIGNKNINENSLIEVIEELDIKEISKNDSNSVTKFDLTNEQICIKYYYDYLNLLRNDVDKLYFILDNEYREKRFESLEIFKDYINNNKEKLEKAMLSNYQVKSRDGYTEYMCVDEDGRYYIFNATAAMQYTLMLDTYTVDLPEFTEKYNKASEQEKVALNINKIITALNAKDYKYIYSKLADSFKNNYFENEEALEGYLVDNLFENNDVEFEKFAKEGTLYTYKIKVTKIIPEEEKEKYYGKNAPMEYINVVMQLNEGTDFVMSFSIEE